jgi:tRNA (guanine-N7-)-methyltransferase
MATPAPLSRSKHAPRLAALSDIARTDSAATEQRGSWRAHFRQRIGPAYDERLILEIGCFDAQLLAAVASDHPTVGFVGIDWKCKPIIDGAEQIAAAGLQNVILLRSRAQDLLQIFAKAELDEIWIFHPDPCDRPRERANRLVNARFLHDARLVLRDSNSFLTIKTDHAEYYQSVLGLFNGTALPFAITAQGENFWDDIDLQKQTASRLYANRRTGFEHRFVRRHKNIYFIEMRPI